MKYKQKVYALQIQNKAKRKESQSGGAFTLLAEECISRGGIVYGVCLNEGNRAVFVRVTDVGGLKKLKGSKYVQADMGDIYSQVCMDLQSGRCVLFTGTPCQIKGLQRLLEVKKINRGNLYTCDLICHGVPSPLIFKEYIKYIKGKWKGNISGFVFRNKEKGWHSHFETFFAGGRKIVSTDYARIFSSANCLRESCHKCPFTNFDRPGDITIGDFWGIERSHPEADDNTGISAVLLNTQKGESLFDKIDKNEVLFQSTQEEVMQPQLYESFKAAETREQFWLDYKNRPFRYIVFKYGKGGIKGIVKHNTRELMKKTGVYPLVHRVVMHYKKKR